MLLNCHIILYLIVLSSVSTAQIIGDGAGGSNGSPVVVGNSSSTGTTLSTLTKLTGAPVQAVKAGTTDTGGVIGIVISGAGTSGFAQVSTRGLVNCIFSGGTTAGDYVQISAAVAGDCVDSGLSTWPTTGQVIGRAMTTNVGTGTYQIDMFPQEVHGSSVLIVSDYSSFSAALSIAANNTLRINKVVTFTSATVPSTVSLIVEQQGGFNNSGTLTIQGTLQAGDYKIFNGAGAISFSGNSVIGVLNDRWWTVADGSTDDTAALHACALSSISGTTKLPIHMPAGIRRACNLVMQDNSSGCTMAECPGPPRVFGDAGIAPFSTIIKATSACGSSSSDFVVLQNTLSKAGFDNIKIDGGSTTTPGTGASCMDLSWLAGNGAAVARTDHHLHLTGCKDATSSYALKYDNNGSSMLQDIFIDRASGETPSGNQIAFSAVTPGDVVAVDNLKVYSGGIVVADAQTGSFYNPYFGGGLKISGTGTNDWVVNGGQIEVNKISGVAVNCANVSVYACENLTFLGTYLSPTPLASGQKIFDGSIIGGVELHGGRVVLGSGAWAGTITTSQTGFPAKFTAWNTFISGTLPSNNAQYLVKWDNVDNGGKTVSSVSGPGAYFATVASAAAFPMPSSTPNVVISGTTTITSILSVFAGMQGTIITTSAVPFTAGSNIGNSCTTTPLKLYTWYYDGGAFWLAGTGC